MMATPVETGASTVIGDAVIATYVPRDLDLHVVLVGPHEGHGSERHRRGVVGEQAPSGGDALLRRVRPVLEAHELAVEQRVGPAADVAGRDDTRRSRQR